MNTETAADKAAVNSNETEQERSLCLFQSSISVHVYDSSLVYRPLNSNNYIVKYSIAQLAGLDVRVRNMDTCMIWMEKHGKR